MVGRNLLAHPAAGTYQCIAPPRSELNLAHAEPCYAYLRETRPDLIIHAAGRVGGIQANMADPAGFLSENLTSGLTLVMAARRADIPALLNLGSSCMYPRNAPNPLTEDSLLSGPLEPTNEGYALAKIAIARLCAYISAQDGLAYRTVIPCNIFGLHDSFDPERSHLIPGILHKTHRARTHNESRIEVWGDGQARREFMYSADLADGIWHLARRIEDMPPMMNLGVGADHTVLAYYRAVADVIGWQGTYVFNRDRPEGMAQKLVSTAWQSRLGWTPGTPLREALALTYAHYCTRTDLCVS